MAFWSFFWSKRECSDVRAGFRILNTRLTSFDLDVSTSAYVFRMKSLMFILVQSPCTCRDILWRICVICQKYVYENICYHYIEQLSRWRIRIRTVLLRSVHLMRIKNYSPLLTRWPWDPAWRWEETLSTDVSQLSRLPTSWTMKSPIEDDRYP